MCNCAYLHQSDHSTNTRSDALDLAALIYWSYVVSPGTCLSLLRITPFHTILVCTSMRSLPILPLYYLVTETIALNCVKYSLLVSCLSWCTLKKAFLACIANCRRNLVSLICTQYIESPLVNQESLISSWLRQRYWWSLFWTVCAWNTATKSHETS